jgi:UDP:flavonoid glycosyltransferase YjiC (YdhE family)
VQGSGHFHPLVPVARAVVAAGHDVAFVGAASFVPTVERVGFRALPAGFDNRGRTASELLPGYSKMTGSGKIWSLAMIFVGVYAVAMTPDARVCNTL